MSLLLAAALAGSLAPAIVATGKATWYDDGPGLYAAVPSYSWGDARYPVKVCRADDLKHCVTVTVRDHCNCHVGTPIEKTIDLSPTAFAKLQPLSRGVVKVVVYADIPAPPPTDTIPWPTIRSAAWRIPV